MKTTVFRRLVVLLAAMLPWSVSAQYDLDHPSRIIRVEDGLPNHYLRGMVQDAYGFIWIGSSDGLSRFDGQRVTVFRHQDGDSLSLTQNTVAALAADPNNGQVWVGTFSGLNVYQPETGRFRTYTHDDQDAGSLPSNYVIRLHVDRQSVLWLGSRSNVLIRLDITQDRFISYEPEAVETEQPETIQDIVQGASDELIWVGTNARLLSFDKKRGTFDYSHSSIKGIRQIHPHSNGLLYILDATGRITVYQPQTKEILDRLEPADGWNFGSLFRKSPNELWISCNKGVAVLHTDGSRVAYPWPNDPARKIAYDIDLVDRQGRVWASGVYGVKIYDPVNTQFSNYRYETTGASPPFITQRLLEDPDRGVVFLNVGAGDGVYRFDLQTREWLHIPIPEYYEDKLFYGSDLALLENGQLLILDRHGLSTLSADGQSMVPHPVSRQLPPERSWRNCFLDSKGHLWLAGLDNRIVRINTRNWEVTSLAEQLPSCSQSRSRWAFYEDSQGNIWITICGGIAYYTYREDAFQFLLHADDPEHTFRNPKYFVEDHDRILWVSNEEDGQLGTIDPAAPENGIYRKHALKQHAPGDAIRILKGPADASLGVAKMAVDPANNLWTIGPSGLIKILPDRKSVEIYNDLDGLQWLDSALKVPTANVIETLSTGEMMVGLRKTMSIFDPAKLSTSRESPQPYLTAFNVYNNPWPSDSSLFVTRRIDLNYWENYFSFEFSAIGFTDPDHYQYRYKLEGVDKDWVHSGQRSYVGYTNVGGGDYTFMVQVANRDGVWNEEPLRIDVSVATPWWQRLWFKAGVILLLLGGVYAFYRYRMHQVRQAERVRSQFENKLAGVELKALRSQMNPHFIFNCLNSIESYIIRNETIKASEYLNNFSRLIRLILQNSRFNYVSLQDELEALSLYMQMENLRLRGGFTYEIILEEGLEPGHIDIPPMLLQPYVENAIWHGLSHKKEGGVITIELKMTDNLLRCIIQDNGVGRQKSAELRPKRQKKTSMGMNITRERIDIINKSQKVKTSVQVIDLVSPEGEAMGTRVELSIVV